MIESIELTSIKRFIKERLTAMAERPEMWAPTKEAFLLQLALLVEVFQAVRYCDISLEPRNVGNELLRKLTPNSNAIPVGDTTPEWAHDIIRVTVAFLDAQSW
jgi:hypothetical protein